MGRVILHTRFQVFDKFGDMGKHLSKLLINTNLLRCLPISPNGWKKEQWTIKTLKIHWSLTGIQKLLCMRLPCAILPLSLFVLIFLAMALNRSQVKVTRRLCPSFKAANNCTRGSALTYCHPPITLLSEYPTPSI